MSRRRRENGSALIVTLLASALLMPLGALAVLEVRSGQLIQQGLRAETEAFYAAEAALAWATAALPIDAEVDNLLAGPDGINGSTDDGIFPFDPSSSGYQPVPPVGVEVRVEAAGGNLLRLTATGFGARDSTRVLERLLRRAELPYSPGAVFVAAGGVSPSFGSSNFVVNGFDHAHDTEITAASGAGSGLPAIAYGSAAAEASARLSLTLGVESQLVGAAGTPSLGHNRPIDLNRVVERASQAAGIVTYDPLDLPADLQLGSAAAPQMSVIPGDTTIDGIWQGFGVLVAAGRLRVRGSLDFNGVIIARDGLVVESAGSAHLHGVLWLGSAPLDLYGSGGIAYCGECLATVDSAFPTLLPHPFEPLSWREASG